MAGIGSYEKGKKLFTPAFVNYLGGTESEAVKTLIGNFDLKIKGKRDITE